MLNAPPIVAPDAVVPGGVEPRISPVNRPCMWIPARTGLVTTLVMLQSHPFPSRLQDWSPCSVKVLTPGETASTGYPSKSADIFQTDGCLPVSVAGSNGTVRGRSFSRHVTSP